MCCETETEPAAASYHFPLYTGETKLAASDVVTFFLNVIQAQLLEW